jgi:hypothetical protein
MTSTLVARDAFGFDSSTSTGDGLAVHMLNPKATLVVRTRHSRYKISVLDGPRHLVLVEGGVFPEPTVVRLSGATLGGSAVKLGWIVVGLRLEFGLGPRRITSSAVLSITTEPSFADVDTYDEKAAA